MERLTFDNNVRYVGKLATISSSNPSDMIVRFQLSKFLNIYWTTRDKCVWKKWIDYNDCITTYLYFWFRSSWFGIICNYGYRLWKFCPSMHLPRQKVSLRLFDISSEVLHNFTKNANKRYKHHIKGKMNWKNNSTKYLDYLLPKLIIWINLRLEVSNSSFLQSQRLFKSFMIW